MVDPNSKGGQFYYLCLLVVLALIFSIYNPKLGETILTMLLGGLLRDMQDTGKS